VTDGARHPEISTVADGVRMIDTRMTGEPELNAVYLLEGEEPCLVEAGPGADLGLVLEALDSLGVDHGDLAHIVVTHIHIDHAGACGALSRRFGRATVWAHERGAPHLADPTRLVASTARTYGLDRMRAFFGETLPVDEGRLRALSDGDSIPLGDRALSVLHTPGHASHHIALHDTGSGAVFTGESIGSHMPWGPAYRPALPPPEVEVEMALASIELIRSRDPSSLLTSHFGPTPGVPEACDTAARQIRTWSETVRLRLEQDPECDTRTLAADLAALAADEFQQATGRPIDMTRYDALGSIGMNAAGLARYWRKRRERATPEPEPER
jgi:glyoxylase-like metal-dependent hydrolase (beta-lactamase superfamily II)